MTNQQDLFANQGSRTDRKMAGKALTLRPHSQFEHIFDPDILMLYRLRMD